MNTIQEKLPTNSLIEQSLTEIWSTILRIDNVMPSDNFFQIGGDSLLALVIIEQMKQRLGWEISLGDFLRYPTIKDIIANKLQEKAASADKTMIRMARRGQHTPVIFMHPIGGLIFSYAKLTRVLGRDRGCYGLQSPALTGLTVPPSVEQIAETYAEIIYDELGTDDFHLVGWSFGGVLAFEIARIAAEKDLNLQKLILIDSYIGSAYFPTLNEEELLNEFYRDLISQISLQPLTFPAQDSTHIFQVLAQAFFGQEGNFGVQFITRLYEGYKANMHAMVNYKAQPTDASCLFLHDLENPTVNTWANLFQGAFTSEFIHGGHYGLLEEQHAITIANQIQNYINL